MTVKIGLCIEIFHYSVNQIFKWFMKHTHTMWIWKLSMINDVFQELKGRY